MSKKDGKKYCDVLHGFIGNINKHRPSVFYQIGLLITAFVMILLPVIYICMIIGVGILLYLHAMNFENIASISGSARINGRAIILLYLGPLAVGVAVLILMIKPLFVRRPKRNEPFVARPEAEPLLHEFIQAVCKQIGAPVPKKVYIDLEVNASASFIKHPFALRGRGLALTIGLPLLACMNLRMLAGVLAHEFGHFSQEMGMRLSYIINSVNIWFAMVVYQRDNWDIWLKDAASSDSYYIIIIAQIARLMVFLTRRILWLLMMLGHVISSFMSRQMEYDADRYQAKLTGSDFFEETSLALYITSCANNKALDDIGESWSQKKLCNDIASLSKYICSKMPDGMKKAIKNNVLESSVGLFATHPSTPNRIERAVSYEEPGIFSDSRPAHILLSNIQKVSQYLTKKYYQNALGPLFNEQYLVSFNDFIGVKAIDHQDNMAYSSFFYNIIDLDNPLPLDVKLPKNISDLSLAVKELNVLCSQIEKQLENAQKAREEFDRLENDIHKFHRIKALVESGYEYTDEKYGKFPANKSANVQIVIDTLCHKQIRHKDTIAEFAVMVAKRLTLSLHLANAGKFADKHKDDKFAAKVKAITSNMKVISHCFADIREMQVLASQIDTLFQYMEGHESEPAIISSISSRLEIVKKRLNSIYTKLKDTRYPFSHATKDISIGDYTFNINSITGDESQLPNAVSDAISNTHKLYTKLLGRLALLTISAEKACGYKMTEQKSA